MNLPAYKSDYLAPDKFIRDLVHGYVYLTKFDLLLIDTLPFQRLGDIRQLSSDHVYPAARHTRFEHSLGVLDLMRKAMQNINNNGFIMDAGEAEEPLVLDEQLQFNGALAALLHDIGHCPFSHLGELEFDREAVRERLLADMAAFPELAGSALAAEFRENPAGAKHEQLSCIVILEKYADTLQGVKEKHILLKDGSVLSVDLELIFRAILGMRYPVADGGERSKAKNVVVGLLNSDAFDMDKLDYIMRDSLFTGIGTPDVDTNRLFRNLYLNNREEYRVVFKIRAVPALQNMIEARDGLYMYVYNHHTAVYSDFMNRYIFRRLVHNEGALIELAALFAAEMGLPVGEGEIRKRLESFYDGIPELGVMPGDYLFSPAAVVEQAKSDSDMIALVNRVHRVLEPYFAGNRPMEDLEKLLLEKLGQLLETDVTVRYENRTLRNAVQEMFANIQRVYKLIDSFQKREYLKSWWKTNSEFIDFISARFPDERVRDCLCDWVCNGVAGIPGAEFSSELAKNVSYITRELEREGLAEQCGLFMPLEPDEFFVIPRSTRFFAPETISELYIAMRSGEIPGTLGGARSNVKSYYIRELTNVIPQRYYYPMYAKNGFYVFSKRLPAAATDEKRNRHYQLIEKIFVFAAARMVTDGEEKFAGSYGKSAAEAAGEAARRRLYEDFLAQMSV